ncbi:hypothetical protein N8J89_36335 [Crossiella sp. CA-258035]|uniref:DUF7878 domain-containing protein n=1 Tax=Crossiella sp. CA-258035 TaxID=2981138 RepID=UPI0024BD3002|nr:hypothetical protein [Crossiella sp. CA-258035]WHT18521.1 hypothetical protein N8J89_36335 [Crossiella sp. CA-258035]
MVELELTALQSAGLNGHSVAQVQELVEGDLRLCEDGRELYAEQDFPVVKLAGALRHWLATPVANRPSFSFDDDSFEQPEGVLLIDRVPAGWRFGSVFAPGAWSGPVSDAEADQVVLAYLGTLRLEFSQLLGRELDGYL